MRIMSKIYQKNRLYLVVFIVISVLMSGCKNDQSLNENSLPNNSSYIRLKNELILNDQKKSFDYDVVLSKEELELNKNLVALRDLFEKNIKVNKLKFYNEPFHNVKNFIEATSLFEVIESMPKGSLLHTHSGGVTDIAWVISRAKEFKNCFVYCEPSNDKNLYGQLAIFEKSKAPKGFVSLNEKIETDANFSTELYNLLILDRNSLSSTDDYWVEFEKRFMRIMPLISYRPFFKEYYKKSFLDLLNNNINHVEIRFIFGNLFDENNSSYPIDTMVADLQNIVLEVQKTHPKFSLNLIYTSFKFLGVKEISNQLNEAFRLKKKYPDFITGFDLVAEEDRGNTINYYDESWKKLDSLERETGLNLPLFLHAGESNSIRNKNLYDAVALNSKRIGHGLNLVLYPKLLEEVKRKDILVEVNPLSNKILGYVPDLRNHPARILLSNGVQCSISSDDSGVYGYQGLSYDFFMAFVAWELDLKAVKKLVFNSVKYSTLDDDRKKKALTTLEIDWNNFVAKSNQFLNKKDLN
jgi:adenosine deaminase CECR1